MLFRSRCRVGVFEIERKKVREDERDREVERDDKVNVVQDLFSVYVCRK